MLCDAPRGAKRGWSGKETKQGNICIHTADSLGRMQKLTTLESNYIPILKKEIMSS